ncbi:MAG: dihydropteroate synthase, partial [Candidatus Eisenbacteria bacterium]|nr:dihydropteroate synthase [Candidatus Eisenbacteria bacterium]
MPAILPDRDGRLCLVREDAGGSLIVEYGEGPQGAYVPRDAASGESLPRAYARYRDARAVRSTWRFGAQRHDLTDRVMVMGVLNCTPDSFYDGSRRASAREAVAAAREMVEAGVDIVDVGGESTRPGAAAVSPDEEGRRVLPVVEAAAAMGVPVSIDTRRAAVARQAIRAGATIVNDVSGFRDSTMVEALADSSAGAVVMHMRGEPATMQDDPRYDWPLGAVALFLAGALDRLAAAGVAEERIVIDPGIGFGKTLDHNIELLRNIGSLRYLGRPVLVGVSRKSFIGGILGLPPDQRLEGSLAAACAAVLRGARIVRVHDA